MPRFPVLATLLLAAVLAPVPAHASLLDGCHARAYEPNAAPGFYTESVGGFYCDQPTTDLSVQVCLEVLDDVTVTWVQVSCGDGYEPGPAPSVEAWTFGCWWGTYLYRTTATGSAGDGRTDSAASLPVPFYCTPL